MKGQKQSRTQHLEKRMTAVTNVLQGLINEISNLKTMLFGQHELIKNIDGYKEALEKLKEKVSEKPSKEEEIKTN